MTRVMPSLRLTVSRPEIQSRAASLFFSASCLVVALQIALRPLVGLFAVAVMRLVVEHQDVLHAHQVGHHPLEHLPFGFQRVQFLAAALEQGTAAFGKLDALAQLEGVVVGDDDLGAVESPSMSPGTNSRLCSSCPGRWAGARGAGRGWSGRA